MQAHSQGHNDSTVNVASTAGPRSIFANKAGTSLIKVAHPPAGLAATATTLAPTTLTTVPVGDHGPDGGIADMAPNIVTMGTLAIQAGPPTYNATLTATTTSTAPGLDRVNNIDCDNYDDNNDNTPTTGDPTTAHPISQMTLPSIPEVHNISHTPPPWATWLEAMVLLLVADSSESKWQFINIDADIAAFNEQLDSLHNNLLTDVLAAADTHIITSVTNTLTLMTAAITNKIKNELDLCITKHL